MSIHINGYNLDLIIIIIIIITYRETLLLIHFYVASVGQTKDTEVGLYWLIVWHVFKNIWSCDMTSQSCDDVIIARYDILCAFKVDYSYCTLARKLKNGTKVHQAMTDV